jgi:methanethiol S-methyltransferase
VDARRIGDRAFAWAGAGLFASALAYFLFAYSVTFGEITADDIDPIAILFDVAIFSVFALHHSIFARDSVRAVIRRTLPAHLERSVYVWVASLMLIGVCVMWRPVQGVLWQVQRPWSWLLLVVQLGGVWLTLRGAAVIDVWSLAGVRQAAGNFHRPLPDSQREPWELEAGRSEFKTEGPYGLVRHPIYLGWILLVFAIATMTMTRFVFAAVSTVYILIAIPFEERTLQRNSAGAYDLYMRQVRSKLIPHLY